MSFWRTKRISHHAYVFTFASQREIDTCLTPHHHCLPIADLPDQEHIANNERAQQRGSIASEKRGTILASLRTFEQPRPGIRNDSLSPPFAKTARKVRLKTAHQPRRRPYTTKVCLQAEQFFDGSPHGQGCAKVTLVVPIITMTICNRSDQTCLANDRSRPERICILARLLRANMG